MKCSKIQKKLSDYLDDALPDNGKEEIASHLLTCAICQEELSILKKLQSTLGQIDDISIPDGFSSNLIGRIRETERKKETVAPYSIFCRTVMTAACAAMVLLSIIFGNHIGRMLYKETAGKRLPGNTKVIEILETQAGIELANYPKNRVNYDVLNGGLQ